MANPTHQIRPRHRVNWGFLITATFFLVVALGSLSRAEEYQTQIPPPGAANPLDENWNWNNPKMWLHGAKLYGAPASAADVGVIPAGRQLAVWKPLGADKDRPSIRVEKGAELEVLFDMFNPLIIAGGSVSGLWLGKSINSPITVTADSLMQSRDDGQVELRVNGQVSNSAPVTLHFSGCISWQSNSSKSFTGNINVDRGNLYIDNPLGSRALGPGPILLAPATKLLIWQGTPDLHYLCSNDVSGTGTIQAGNGHPSFLVAAGATLHPGVPQKPGTLDIFGSLDFQRNSAGQPAKLVIDVQGDGSNMDADYGQLAVVGGVTDSLGNVDMILQLKPGMTAEQAAQLHLIVLSAVLPDPVKMSPKPFHSVQVIAGDRKGTATATRKLDPLTGGMVVEVTDITLK